MMNRQKTERFRVTGVNGAGKVQHEFKREQDARNLANAMVLKPGPSGKPSFIAALVEYSKVKATLIAEYEWEFLTQYTRR